MPNKPALDGKDPAELVYVHAKIPLWLKRRVVTEAQNRGQDLTAFFIALLVKELGTRGEKPPRR